MTLQSFGRSSEHKTTCPTRIVADAGCADSRPSLTLPGGPNTKWTFVPAGGAPDRFYILLSVSSNLRSKNDSACRSAACTIKRHSHLRACHSACYPAFSACSMTPPLPHLYTDGACRLAWLPCATRATRPWPGQTAAIQPPISRPSPIPRPAWSGWSTQFHLILQ